MCPAPYRGRLPSPSYVAPALLHMPIITRYYCSSCSAPMNSPFARKEFTPLQNEQDHHHSAKSTSDLGTERKPTRDDSVRKAPPRLLDELHNSLCPLFQSVPLFTHSSLTPPAPALSHVTPTTTTASNPTRLLEGGT